MTYVETDCTFEHEGRSFESGGAVITPDYVIGYVGDVLEEFPIGAKLRALTNWHGLQIGTIRLTSSWRTPRSYVSSHYYQAYAKVDGVTYTGRTAGKGMIFKGRRAAKQA